MKMRWFLAGATFLAVVVTGRALWGAVSRTGGDVAQLPSLRKTAEFSLGFRYDPQDSTSWIAAASKRSDLLVAYDSFAHQIRTYGLDGRPVGSFGGEGMLPGQFVEPTGLAIDSEGGILVADQGIPVIRSYNKTGTLIREYAAVVGVKGWGDVAAGDPGAITASPSAGSSLLGKKGVLVLADGVARSVCEECFGPVAVDDDQNVYLLNWNGGKEGTASPHLIGFDSSGTRLFSQSAGDNSIKPDLQFWPEAHALLVVNAGKRQVAAYRLDGTLLGTLMVLPAGSPPPIGALPVGNSLLLVLHDGTVQVYTAAFDGAGR